MPEDRVPDLVDALDELLGLHPPVWTLIQQTVDTISRLADRGNSILIGRGAHIITSARENVFHVRLVSSLPKRVEHIQKIRGIGRHEALSVIRNEDRGRRRYLKSYFGKDIDDPLTYHLVVNTEFISYQATARLIAETALANLRIIQSSP